MVLDPSQLTNADGSCPELESQFKELAELVCRKLTDARVYVDAADAGLQSQIDALVADSSLLERIQSLQSLIDSLDTDGDGTLNELLGLQSQIDELKAKCARYEVDIANNSASITNIDGRLTTYIDNNNAKMVTMEGDILSATNTAASAQDRANEANKKAGDAAVAAAEAKAVGTQNATDIADLTDRMDNMLDSEAVEGLMDAVECRARKAVSKAAIAFAQSLASCSAFPSVTPAPSEDPVDESEPA